MKFRLGWDPGGEDRFRLESHALRYSFADFELPEEVNTRSWLNIEDQSNMSSCVGNASSTVAEIAFHIASGGQVIQLSRMWAYLKSQEIAGITGDRGSQIDAASESGKMDGYCLESLFPYPNRYTTQIPQGCKEDAEKRQIRQHVMIKDYDGLITWIGSGSGAVLVGMLWTQELANCNGLVEDYVARNVLGGHAVAWVGYDKDKMPDLANSHGKQWGDGGFARWTRKAIDKVLGHRDTVAIGMTDMEYPKPRRIPKPKHSF